MIAPSDITTSRDQHPPQGERYDASPSPAEAHAAGDHITPRQRWAHLLVLDIINANLPLARLADHLKIPFDTLIDYIKTPEVQAEIDAYEELNALRARLLGEAARPISLRKLLDVLESPAPKLTGRDPDADQRILHRHAELIRRTATTIARESRALAPKPAPAPKPAARAASVNERTSSSASEPAAAPESLTDQRPQKGAPSASSGSSSSSSHAPDTTSEPAKLNRGTAGVPERTTAPNHTRERRVACLGEDQACADDADNPPTGRTIDPRESLTDAEDALGCASPDAVDAPRQQPTGSTESVDPSAQAPQPAPAPSDFPSPSAPSFLSPLRDAGSSASSAFNNSAPPLRDSDSSAASAFSSRSRHARDRPAA
ncbi:MAG: hypothetical protein KF912_08840 [Phycisphaeraceae bacterium]|nr:hypothetical protein [Phycisphaeraceae bacterium]